MLFLGKLYASSKQSLSKKEARGRDGGFFLTGRCWEDMEGRRHGSNELWHLPWGQIPWGWTGRGQLAAARTWLQGPSTVQAQSSSAETERGRIWLLAMKSFRRSRARGTG